jgi:CO/xanthine dehydrogenase FAD-binding subunit
MHDFDYQAPRSVEELGSLLDAHGKSARVFAGGTDLLIKMRAGSVRPDLLVDVKGIAEMNTLQFVDGELMIGAAVCCRTLYENTDVCRAYPALTEAASVVGGVQNQGRATVGGNICNASPSADLVPPLIASGAVAWIRNKSGLREQPIEELFLGPGETSISAAEALCSVRLPRVLACQGVKFIRFTPRNEMDIAVANVAVSVELDEQCQVFQSARIALGAVAPTPLLAREAGDCLSGQPVSDASIEMAAKLARNAVDPIDDMRGSASQRRHLVGVLVRQAIAEAVSRARGEAG